MADEYIQQELKFGVLVTLRRRIADPSSLMRKIGGILIAGAQKAFKVQALGDFKWPARPGRTRSGQPINVAGIIADFNKGTWNLPARRFQDRPALIDTTSLLRSLTVNKAVQVKNKYTVEVGTTLPYAGVHQWGGESIQQITRQTRLNLSRYLLYLRKQEKSHNRRGKGFSAIWIMAKRMDVDTKLNFIFYENQYKTRIPQRPYLGITDESERLIREEVEAWFGRSA